MYTLSRALHSWEGKGRKIELPWPKLASLVDFRTGDLAMLAGAPGGGKSLVALNWAWRSEDLILYLAQDSPRSVLRRLAALALKRRVSEIHEEQAAHWGDRTAGRRENLILALGSHTVDDIRAKIVALTEWWMTPPSIVFIDNLFDLRSDKGSYMDTSFYSNILPSLKRLAIEADVGIVMLHHVTRSSQSFNDQHGLGTSPLRMTDLLFAGERESRHVWGVYRGSDNREINFQILKAQDGQADPSGRLSFPINWTPEEGRLWQG